jgi:hypothetical protein
MSKLSFLYKDKRIKDSALQEVRSRGHGPDTKLNGQQEVAECCFTNMMIEAAGDVQLYGYSWSPRRGRLELNLIFGVEAKPTFIRQTVTTPL